MPTAVIAKAAQLVECNRRLKLSKKCRVPPMHVPLVSPQPDTAYCTACLCMLFVSSAKMLSSKVGQTGICHLATGACCSNKSNTVRQAVWSSAAVHASSVVQL